MSTGIVMHNLYTFSFCHHANNKLHLRGWSIT